jgi:hypothetical protein
MKHWRRFIAALMLAASVSAHAADTDPLDLPLRQYGLILFMALLGGIVSFAAKVRAGTVQTWNVMYLIGELATSAFAGLLTFYGCVYLEVSQVLTAALVGIAGHMGTRAITLYEDWAQRRAGKT